MVTQESKIMTVTEFSTVTTALMSTVVGVILDLIIITVRQWCYIHIGISTEGMSLFITEMITIIMDIPEIVIIMAMLDVLIIVIMEMSVGMAVIPGIEMEQVVQAETAMVIIRIAVDLLNKEPEDITDDVN